jgi:hypothetical protein
MHRREHWASWDPHFLHYSRPALQRAIARAADLADKRKKMNLVNILLHLQAQAPVLFRPHFFTSTVRVNAKHSSTTLILHVCNLLLYAQA